MRAFVVGLVVLLALLVGADRLGDAVAQRLAASTLQESQGLSQRPEVAIAGFPFLDQFLRRDFDEIDVRARQVPLRGPGGDTVLDLRRLDVTLSGVTVTSDLTRFEADRARATAVLGYDELGELLGVDLSSGPGGRVRVATQFEILGESVEPEILIRPRVVDGGLSFVEPSVNGISAGVDLVLSQLNDVFGTPIPLQGIPFDIAVDDVRTTERGVLLNLSGRDLSYVEE